MNNIKNLTLEQQYYNILYKHINIHELIYIIIQFVDSMDLGCEYEKIISRVQNVNITYMIMLEYEHFNYTITNKPIITLDNINGVLDVFFEIYNMYCNKYDTIKYTKKKENILLHPQNFKDLAKTFDININNEYEIVKTLNEHLLIDDLIINIPVYLFVTLTSNGKIMKYFLRYSRSSKDIKNYQNSTIIIKNDIICKYYKKNSLYYILFAKNKL